MGVLVGCRGGSRSVEGCWGCLYYLEIKKFLGLLVSWFLDFWFLGFRGSWLFGLLVSKFLSFKDSTNLESSETILPALLSSHFMFFDRYCSHIQDFQEFIRQIFIIVRRPSFPNFSKLWIFQK